MNLLCLDLCSIQCNVTGDSNAPAWHALPSLIHSWSSPVELHAITTDGAVAVGWRRKVAISVASKELRSTRWVHCLILNLGLACMLGALPIETKEWIQEATKYQWAWLGKRKQTPQNCPLFFTDQWKNIKPHYLNARTFFFLPDLFRKYHSSCRTIPKNILSKSIPRPPQLYHPGFKIDHIPNFSNFQTPPAPGELSNPDPGRDPIKCFRAAFSGNILGQNNSAQKLRPKTQHRA